MISFLTLVLAVSAVGTFGSCKDYDEDNRVELQGEYAKLGQDLTQWIEQVKQCQNSCKEFRENLVGTDGEGGRLHGIDVSIEKMGESIQTFEEILQGLNAGDGAQLANILTSYSQLQEQVSTVYTLFGTLTPDQFNSKLNEIETLGQEIAALTGTEGQLTKIGADIAALQTAGYITADEATTLIERYGAVKQDAIDIAIRNLRGNDDATLTLASLQTALDSAEEELQDQIDALSIRLDAFEKELAELKANFGQLVTSVLVQGTYNPIFGSLTAPFNVQSNVLAAYYGKAEVEGSFPLANPGMLVNSSNALTAKDKEMIESSVKGAFDFNEGQLLTDNNAGTIYLTINPTGVDFTGLKFRLENSLGEASPVVLDILKPSSKKLTFGWTRGASANGFYEAKAVVSNENIENAKLVVDMTRSDIQEIFKDITSPRDGIDIMNIANKVYSTVNDVCDASAVKAYWGEGASANSVLSQYNIAATAVKPLSFAFMKDYHMDSFWGVDRVQNFINNTINGINFKIDFGTDIEVPEIKKITIEPFEASDKYKEMITIEDRITVNGVDYELNLENEFKGQEITVDVKDNGVKVGEAVIDVSQLFAGKVINITTDPITKDIKIEKVVDFNDMISEVYGQVTAPIEEVNTMLGNLDTFMKQVNNMLTQINNINKQIDDAKQSIADQINKYIDALNKRLCNVVNGIHDRLQPLAIAHNGKEFYTLSGIKNYPSKVSGNTLHIVPTTYTAELVVPVFKKHVAVTNVFKGSASAQAGDGECTTVLNNANQKGGMNTVVPGTTRDVEFVGEKGYIYEIAYSALDYSGKAVTKKYYVTVTE